MTKYYTEGIVKDIDLHQDNGTFTLQAAPPYAIEEKNGDKTETAILFVADADDKSAQSTIFSQKTKDGAGEKTHTQKSAVRNSFLVQPDSTFKFILCSKPFDTATLLMLKQNRCRIRIVIEGEIVEKTTVATGKKFAISEIIIK